MDRYKEIRIKCPNCGREMKVCFIKEKDKLEQFLEWLKEENNYPLLSHDELIENLEKYELEIETSSEKEVNVV